MDKSWKRRNCPSTTSKRYDSARKWSNEWAQFQICGWLVAVRCGGSIDIDCLVVIDE